MENIKSFFSPTSVEDEIKNTKRTVDKSKRNINHDIAALDREEKMTTARLKEAAKRGNEVEIKILAKQIIQIRQQKEKMAKASATLGTVKTNATLMGTQYKVTQAMDSTTKTMQKMNAKMDPQKMGKQVGEFSKMQMKMDMSEEMMDDLLSSTFDEGVEEEADEVTKQILDELGVEQTKSLASAPTSKVAGNKNASSVEEDEEVDKLMKNLLKS